MENITPNPQEIYRKSTTLPDEFMLFDINDSDKIELFEKCLDGQIEQSDSLNQAVEKIVKAALNVEFGESIMKSKSASNMVATISRGILGDNELRKQILIIMDRFAKPKELNA